MKDNHQSFLEHEKKVNSVLHTVYDFSNSPQGCSPEEIVEATKLSTEEVEKFLTRLLDEKLIGIAYLDSGYAITEKGRSKLAAYIKELEVASEIQKLLKQLEQDYPTGTLTEKAFVAEEAIKKIEDDPTLKSRFVATLKSAGKEAFKEAIDHPLVNILMAGVEGWQEGG